VEDLLAGVALAGGELGEQLVGGRRALRRGPRPGPPRPLAADLGERALPEAQGEPRDPFEHEAQRQGDERAEEQPSAEGALGHGDHEEAEAADSVPSARRR